MCLALLYRFVLLTRNLYSVSVEICDLEERKIWTHLMKSRRKEIVEGFQLRLPNFPNWVMQTRAGCLNWSDPISGNKKLEEGSTRRLAAFSRFLRQHLNTKKESLHFSLFLFSLADFTLVFLIEKNRWIEIYPSRHCRITHFHLS